MNHERWPGRGGAVAAVAAFAGIVTAMPAPTGAVAAVAASSGTAAASSPQAVFRAATDFVARDVIVRDAGGAFVADLGRDDFRVLEDGAEQRVEWFTLVSGGQVVTDTVPGPVRTSEGLLMPPPKPRETPARIWIVFIDDLHLQALDTPVVRRVLTLLGERVLAPGDLVAYVSTGPSSIASDLSYDVDRRRLREAIDKVMGAAPSVASILRSPPGARGPADVRYGAHVAFSTVRDLLRLARDIPNRRKGILYVSGGYDFDPLGEARRAGGDPFARAGDEFADADLVAELAELTRLANRANVTIHTIDPRGLDAGPPMDFPLSAADWGRWTTRRQTSLRVIAEQTGGRAVVNTNEFDAAFGAIADDMSDYYVLGYTSTLASRGPGERVVQITVPSRPGLTLSYQRQYVRR